MGYYNKYIHCSSTDPTAVRPSASSPLPQVLVLTLSFQNHIRAWVLAIYIVIDNLVGGESGGRYTKFTKLQPNLYVYFVIGRLLLKGFLRSYNLEQAARMIFCRREIHTCTVYLYLRSSVAPVGRWSLRLSCRVKRIPSWFVAVLLGIALMGWRNAQNGSQNQEQSMQV